MKFKPNRYYLFALGVVLLSTAYCAYIWTNTRFNNGDDEANNNSTQRAQRSTTRQDGTDAGQQTRNNRSPDGDRKHDAGKFVSILNDANIEKLIALAPQVGGYLTGDYVADIELFRAYTAALPQFSINQVGELVKSWPSKGKARLFSYIAQHLNDTGYNRERAIGIINSIPVDKYSHNFVQLMAKRHMVFDAKNLSQTLVEVEPAYFDAIGEGLSEKVANLKGAEQQKRIREYYTASTNPRIVGGLAVFVVAQLVLEDLDVATKWLLDGSPELVKSGDYALIKELESRKESEEAVGFANALIERSEMERANRAVKVIAEFDRGDSEKLFRWGASLPSELNARNQVMVTAFSRILHLDRVKARALIDAVKEPELKRLLQATLAAN